jgi:hypothetical protein
MGRTLARTTADQSPTDESPHLLAFLNPRESPDFMVQMHKLRL